MKICSRCRRLRLWPWSQECKCGGMFIENTRRCTFCGKNSPREYVTNNKCPQCGMSYYKAGPMADTQKKQS